MMNTYQQNPAKTNWVKRTPCGWSFETIDPQHPNPEKRAAVRCPQCKTFYIASVIAGKRCVNDCEVEHFVAVDLEGRIVQPLEVKPRIPIPGTPGPFYTLSDYPLGSNAEPFDFGVAGTSTFIVRNNTSGTWYLEAAEYPIWVSIQAADGESSLSGVQLAPGHELQFSVRAHFLQTSQGASVGQLRFRALDGGRGNDPLKGGVETTFSLSFKCGDVQWRFKAVLWLAVMAGLYFSLAIGFVLCSGADQNVSRIFLSVPGVSIWLGIVFTLFYASSPELIRKRVLGLIPKANAANGVVWLSEIDKVWNQGMFPPYSYLLNVTIGFLSVFMLMLALGFGRLLTYMLGMQGSFLAGTIVFVGFAAAWMYGLQAWLASFSFNVIQYLVAVFSRRAVPPSKILESSADH